MSMIRSQRFSNNLNTSTSKDRLATWIESVAKVQLRFGYEGPCTIGAEMRVQSLNETLIDRRIALEPQFRIC